MFRIITAAVLSLGIAVQISAQELVSSSPNFRPEGPKPYACTTPKGKKTKCNQWLGFTRLSGWQRKCVYPDVDSMLMKVGYSNTPYLEPPETGCAALYSDLWADTRKWDAKNQKKERGRKLKEGHFNQHVEVKESGSYELGACMARSLQANLVEGPAGGNEGGITATLLQWHPVDTVTVHAVLPNNKTLWGPSDNPLVNVPNRMWRDQADNGEVPGMAAPGTELGLAGRVGPGENPTDQVTVLVYNEGGWIQGELPFEPDGEIGLARKPLDGLEGHGGLGTKYNDSGAVEAGDTTYWVCYNETLDLEPGFYAIRVEVRPFLYEVAPGEYVSDYTGYGAVSNVYLRKAVAISGN